MLRKTVAVEDIKTNLQQAGLGVGSTLLIHAGIVELIGKDSRGKLSPVSYAREILHMLMELVGRKGTLVMSTDSIGSPQEFSYAGRVFDPDKMPSRRGTLTEVFRTHPEVIRSRHPWCNASAWGAQAEWLISEHLLATPFAMDSHSPWFKLTILDATIAYIGVKPRTANLCIVMPEHILGYSYPLGVFLDKPVCLNFINEQGDVDQIPVHLNVHDWSKSDVQALLDHLDNVHSLHRRFGKGAACVYTCRAKKQFDVLMREVSEGRYYAHARYWL
ncbi:MAG: AAC(3) family N-acetyltransferase [Burkholderiales bacterium]|nr:AAC(3) family N-acetyltransferase [Burkholderiales bacterium]